jgi:hypothetical protein
MRGRHDLRGRDGRFARAADGPATKGAGKARAVLEPAGQAIAKRNPRWNKARRDIFFAELAELCNVSAAARAAGFADSKPVDREKARDPDFARRFDGAIAEGYSKLELEMLERMRFGKNRPRDVGDSGARQRAIPTATAMQLLRLHHAKAKGAPAAAPAGRAAAPRKAQRPMRGPGSLRAEVEAMLSRINRRFGGQG